MPKDQARARWLYIHFLELLSPQYRATLLPSTQRAQGNDTMRILFADDHALVRESICPYLHRLSDAVEIIEAGSMDEALGSVDHDLDLILLDLQMPGSRGVDGVARMKKAAGDTPIVVLSGFSDKRTINAAFEIGACGFIPKVSTGRTLIRALQIVLDGDRYVPASFLEENEAPSIFEKRSPTIQSAERSVLSQLTCREADSLRHLITGCTNKEIARALDLQEITIKFHLRNAYKKIGAVNRADAVRIAYENNWQCAI
jgi:DNA-binding NarL/FixJ family response regulator